MHVTSRSDPVGGLGTLSGAVGKEDRLLAILSAYAQVEAQMDAALRSINLTVDRWRALAFMHKNPGSSMADLINALVMPSTSATRTVDALVDLGAVFRAHDPADRRRVVLHVSTDGLELIDAAAAALDLVDIPEDLTTAPG